jgi:hypothetical protein
MEVAVGGGKLDLSGACSVPNPTQVCRRFNSLTEHGWLNVNRRPVAEGGTRSSCQLAHPNS